MKWRQSLSHEFRQMVINCEMFRISKIAVFILLASFLLLMTACAEADSLEKQDVIQTSPMVEEMPENELPKQEGTASEPLDTEEDLQDTEIRSEDGTEELETPQREHVGAADESKQERPSVEPEPTVAPEVESFPESISEPVPAEEPIQLPIVTVSAISEVDDAPILQQTELEWEKGDTVLSVLQRATRMQRVTMEYRGRGAMAYVEGIHNVYEFDHGAQSGWIYEVNGIQPDMGAGTYEVSAGDEIRWRYVIKQNS